MQVKGTSLPASFFKKGKFQMLVGLLRIMHESWMKRMWNSAASSGSKLLSLWAVFYLHVIGILYVEHSKYCLLSFGHASQRSACLCHPRMFCTSHLRKWKTSIKSHLINIFFCRLKKCTALSFSLYVVCSTPKQINEEFWEIYMHTPAHMHAQTHTLMLPLLCPVFS